MPLQVEAIAETCRTIARQLRDRHKNLTIHYIIHREGRRAEALGEPSHEVTGHPAAGTALRLLAKAGNDEESALIGVAAARENLFMGLAARDSLLALGTINADRYDNMKDVRAQAWHLAWHAIDALDYHNDPDSYEGASRETVSRNRNALEMAAANLKADVFAAVMAAFQGSGDSAPRLAVARGLAALQDRPGHNPERYPFPVAAESAGIVMAQLKTGAVAKKKWIDTALRTARHIGRTFDDGSVGDWLAFGEPAQDMAWRGYNGEQILSAAINTGDNTQVRSIAHMIAEMTGTKPVSVFDLQNDYSPFASDDYNEKLHERAVDEISGDVFTEMRRQRSADPLVDTANSQNLKLQSGHILGWCAGALQASMRAWAAAEESGRDTYEAARREFDSERSRTAWKSLRALNRKIIGSFRQNTPVTLGSLLEMSRNDRSAVTLLKSIEMTMKDHARQTDRGGATHMNLAAAMPVSGRGAKETRK